MRDETLLSYFNSLDENLKWLAIADSSVEYSPKIREIFNEIVGDVNQIKAYLGGVELLHNPDEYFE